MALKGVVFYRCYCAVSQGSPVDKAETRKTYQIFFIMLSRQ